MQQLFVWLSNADRIRAAVPFTNPLSLSILGGKQLPVPLGNYSDGAAGHFYGGLIVYCVRRRWYPGGQSFQVGQGILRKPLVIQVRTQREINQSQRSIAACGGGESS